MNRSLLIAMLMIIGSCTKTRNEPGQTTGKVPFTITNSRDTVLNFKLYRSAQDYLDDVNVIAAGRVAKGDTVMVDTDLEPQDVYVDIYSDDYQVGNWGNDFGPHGLHLSQRFADLGKIARYTDSSRSYYMDTNAAETRWRAVGGYSTGGPEWDSMPENDRYRYLRLRKDGTFELDTKDSNGNVITLPGFYNWRPNTGLSIRSLNNQGLSYLISIYSFTPDNELDFHSDTLILHQYTMLYKLARE